MKRTWGFASLIVLTIAALALAAGGYWYWQKDKVVVPVPSPTAVPSPTPELTPLPTPVNISEWQESSYSQTQPFTFKYPPGWEEIKRGDGGYNYKPGSKEAGLTLEFFRDPKPDNLEERVASISTPLEGSFLGQARLQIGGEEVVMLTVLYKSTVDQPPGKTLDGLTTRIIIDDVPLNGPFISAPELSHAQGRITFVLSAPASEVSQQELETLAQQIASTFRITEGE